jgi:hypothetical protein
MTNDQPLNNQESLEPDYADEGEPINPDDNTVGGIDWSMLPVTDATHGTYTLQHLPQLDPAHYWIPVFSHQHD